MSMKHERHLMGTMTKPTTKRIRASSPTTVQSPPPPLPLDLQLEIAARSGDVTTVVRCAAASKPLRRAILEPGFRSRLANLADADNNLGSDPDLVMAVSYKIHKHGAGGGVVTRTSPHLRFDSSLLKSFKPASSRNGLLVLWRNHVPAEEGSSSYFRSSRCKVEVELCVCNTFTGHVTFVPRTGLRLGRDDGIRGLYRPALLTAGGGRSFELLVLSHDMRTQTFSAEPDGGGGGGKWGAVRQVSCPLYTDDCCKESVNAPVVVGRIIYRLCHLRRRSDLNHDSITILALDADAADADSIALPVNPLQRPSWILAGHLPDPIIVEEIAVLGATAEGTKLSVVLADEKGMSMWTRSHSEERVWSRLVSISRTAIEKQLFTAAGLGGCSSSWSVRFEGFGWRTCTVLLRMAGVGLVRLDLGTNKAVLLCRCSSHRDTCWSCLQEIDLASLFRGMKHF